MPEPIDRRASERFPVNADTSCSFVSPVVEDFGPVKLQNLSMEGIGLFLSLPLATIDTLSLKKEVARIGQL